MKFYSALDLTRNQVLNLRLQQLGSAPSTPVEGLVYYDTATHEPFVYNGTDWISFLATGGAVAWADITGKPTLFSGSYTDLTNQPTLFDGAYANLTGAPDLTVYAPKASPTFTGTVTVPTPTAGDSSTKAASTAYVRGEITTLIGGAPGTLDTLTELAAAINNDASYASTLTTALATKASTSYVDTAVAGIAGALRYSTTIGDGAATSYVVTHNLNSRDVVIGISEAATPWNVVYADVAKTSVNTVTISGFSVAPATGSLRVTVLG